MALPLSLLFKGVSKLASYLQSPVRAALNALEERGLANASMNELREALVSTDNWAAVRNDFSKICEILFSK